MVHKSLGNYPIRQIIAIIAISHRFSPARGASGGIAYGTWNVGGGA